VSLLRGRSLTDCVIASESIMLALAVEVGLRFIPFARLLEFLDRVASGHPAARAASYDRLRRFASAAYGLLPVQSTCLRESLVLYALLRRRGAIPKLCLGVRKDGPTLAAHAWVECAGVVGPDGALFRELRAIHEQS